MRNHSYQTKIGMGTGLGPIVPAPIGVILILIKDKILIQKCVYCCFFSTINEKNPEYEVYLFNMFLMVV